MSDGDDMLDGVFLFLDNATAIAATDKMIRKRPSPSIVSEGGNANNGKITPIIPPMIHAT